MENRGRLFQLLSQNEQRNAYHRHQAELAEQYTYWDVHSDSVRGRSIMDLMQEHLFETTGKMPTLREVGEILQNYINTNRITTPEKADMK